MGQGKRRGAGKEKRTCHSFVVEQNLNISLEPLAAEGQADEEVKKKWLAMCELTSKA